MHPFQYKRLGGLARIDEWGLYHSPNIAFVDTPATAFSDLMTNLSGNMAGGIQVLNQVNLDGGRVRRKSATFTMAAQASGTVFAVCRLPLFAVIDSIDVITDTSLGSATLAFGDAHNANSAIYGAAATLTALNTNTRFGPPLATCGVQINTGYDYLGKPTTATMPQAPAQGGFNFEDIIMTVGAASLPGSGTLRVRVTYTMEG
jgi:hypothetical protein